MVQKTNHAEKPHPSRLLLTLDELSKLADQLAF
jgi:hypothetical protein